jgi:peptidoglycan/xylan/chitin deacetylase (PgdA/CDA1 family)
MRTFFISFALAILTAGLLIAVLFIAGGTIHPQSSAPSQESQQQTSQAGISQAVTQAPIITPAAVKAPKYEIALSAGDSTPSPSAIKVRYGNKIKKLPVPERYGYEFLGWFTSRVGGEEVANGDEMEFARDTELYARWEKLYEGVDRSVRGLPVLMYHQFYDPEQGEEPKAGLKGNYMLASDFDDQIRYLSENDIYFPSWEEVYAFVKGEIDLPDNSVVITIDDGAKSFYKYAIPTLEKYRVPGTGFIIAKYVKEDTVETYSSDIISLQSHTYDMHRSGTGGRGLFTTIDAASALEDVMKAADILGTRDALAYPYGHYNQQTVNVLAEAGIHMGFTTAYGTVKPGMNPYELPRVRMNAGISLSSFVSQLGVPAQ